MQTKNVVDSHRRVSFRPQCQLRWLGPELSLWRFVSCHLVAKSVQQLQAWQLSPQKNVPTKQSNTNTSTFQYVVVALTTVDCYLLISGILFAGLLSRWLRTTHFSGNRWLEIPILSLGPTSRLSHILFRWLNVYGLRTFWLTRLAALPVCDRFIIHIFFGWELFFRVTIRMDINSNRMFKYGYFERFLSPIDWTKPRKWKKIYIKILDKQMLSHCYSTTDWPLFENSSDLDEKCESFSAYVNFCKHKCTDVCYYYQYYQSRERSNARSKYARRKKEQAFNIGRPSLRMK